MTMITMHTSMSEMIPKFPRQRNAYDHIECFERVSPKGLSTLG